jgi:hypothetical protein
MTTTRKRSDLSHLTREEKLLHHQEQARQRAKKWREDNPDRAASIKAKCVKAKPDHYKKRWKNNHLKSQYGLTLEERDALFEEQGRVCAVCGSDEPGSKHDWHVDHCHVTGAVRGILCHHCNTALGNFKDDPAILLAAVDYLRKHNGNTESPQ